MSSCKLFGKQNLVTLSNLHYSSLNQSSNNGTLDHVPLIMIRNIDQVSERNTVRNLAGFIIFISMSRIYKYAPFTLSFHSLTLSTYFGKILIWKDFSTKIRSSNFQESTTIKNVCSWLSIDTIVLL